MKQLSEELQMMVFDLLEGNLDSASAQKARDMIASDPLMAREYRLMQKTYLVPEPIVFAGKEDIKQPALEMQMLVFDLLEGNLQGEDREDALALIEKNPALKREFREMQAAYLTQEPVLFEDKESLKKKGGAIFYMSPYRAAIAAGLLLLISGLGYVTWRFAGEDALNTVAALPGKNEGPDRVLLPAPAEHADVAEGIPPFAHAQKTMAVSAADGDGIPDTYDTETAGVAAPALGHRAWAMRGAGDMLPPVIVDDASEISFIYLDNTAYNAPVSYERKRSLGHKLLYSTRRMLAQLKTPEIGISFKNTGHLLPKVQMSYKTDKEEVIATLIE